ncbi:hypothetical protein [Mesorhizobium sp. M7A.F.Ce.TU.012.03.2.1]|uniref:hypothetical protein n=1 Tax=Mesorhizobium sp. M7A.F.Ce.TU.012.03.2.1 TaxID=2493681 RepID=UPI0013E2F45B|nr:hypothetical protein [Mesorhizobium sp. M7A.F.Ce.TU.012.03.2.1]
MGETKNDTATAWIERLVKEAGITEDQARELIFLLGLNWSSLLREAKLLRKSART